MAKITCMAHTEHFLDNLHAGLVFQPRIPDLGGKNTLFTGERREGLFNREPRRHCSGNGGAGKLGKWGLVRGLRRRAQ